MISREQFEMSVTGGKLAFIVNCVRGGLADYADPTYYSNVARRDHVPRVRAELRNCHIVGRAQRQAVDMQQGIRTRTVRGRVLFVIDDLVQVSFKKLDGRRRPRKSRTRQDSSFMRQDPLWDDGSIPPELTNVVAGYHANDDESAFEIWVTCPDDRGNSWELRLSNADLLELFPAMPAGQVANEVLEPIRQRVRLRPGVITANGTDQQTNSAN